MTTVLGKISEWASDLPYWEQAALDKIMSGGQLSETDYDELLQYLLEDAGLTERGKQRPRLGFRSSAGSSVFAAGKQLRLKRIYDLTNVNALVPNQVLTFSESLTVIFGANGSGKSGYARVIASAAFTRGDKKILTDVTRPLDPSQHMCAEIELTDGTKLHYEVGQSCPELQGFYVFDSTSVRAHLTRSNPMSFSPAGLGYLTQLAAVTDEVRKRLQAMVKQRCCAPVFAQAFVGSSAVTAEVAKLSAATDLAALRALGTLTPADEARIDAIDLEIAELKSEKIAERIADIRQTIEDLQRLTEALSGLAGKLDDAVLNRLRNRIGQWQVQSASAQNLSVERFKTSFFHEIGGRTWHDFIKAAQALGQAESEEGDPYPHSDSRCLLCHQPLTPEAQNLIVRLWTYLESDAQAGLEVIEKDLQDERDALGSLDPTFVDDQSVSYRHLETHDKDALAAVQHYLAVCQSRQELMLSMIATRSDLALPAFPESPVSAIQALVDALKTQEAELTGLNRTKQIADLAAEQLLLEHRRQLRGMFDDIEQYVADLKWAEAATKPKVVRNTAHISRKYDSLFKELVTDEYLRLFSVTLEKLKCPLRVKVQTRAQKGATFKQIALETDASITPDLASPDKVLSEGEQRAVALADFLTEVALDENSTGVVLDDPVTSLDFAWKETVADHLIAEAQRRQVVVFTHDLHFLYCLRERAGETGELECHWIEKRDDRPGWVFLNNSPIAEKDYKTADKALQFHARAKVPGVAPEEQQYLLSQGFAALRTCYEYFVIFDLFAGVVLRFGERVSVDRLGKVAVDPAIRDEVIDKVGLLSRYIEGHLHSDQHLAQKPTPDVLQKEIDDFRAVKERHKAFKKSQGIKD